MRMYRRERLVLGDVNTIPSAGMNCTVRLMDNVPFSKSMSDQRNPQISPLLAPVSKASCVITLKCTGAPASASKSLAMSSSSSVSTSISEAFGRSARAQGFSLISPH